LLGLSKSATLRIADARRLGINRTAWLHVAANNMLKA
jgi:AraC-like DNA-binding protein